MFLKYKSIIYIFLLLNSIIWSNDEQLRLFYNQQYNALKKDSQLYKISRILDKEKKQFDITLNKHNVQKSSERNSKHDLNLKDYDTWLKFVQALNLHKTYQASEQFKLLQNTPFLAAKSRLEFAKYYAQFQKYAPAHTLLTPLLNDKKVQRFFPELTPLLIQIKLKLNRHQEAIDLYKFYLNYFPHDELNSTIFEEIQVQTNITFNEVFSSPYAHLDYLKDLYSRSRLLALRKKLNNFLTLYENTEIEDEALLLSAKTYYRHYEYKKAIREFNLLRKNRNLSKTQRDDVTFFLAKSLIKIGQNKKGQRLLFKLINAKNSHRQSDAYYAVCTDLYEKKNLKLFKKIVKRYKRDYPSSKYVNKLIWQEEMDQLIKTSKAMSEKQTKRALKTFLPNQEIATRLIQLYAQQFPNSSFPTKKGLYQLPITYDFYHLLENYGQGEQRPELKIIEKYNVLYEYGLGGLALEEIRYNEFVRNIRTAESVWTKINLAQKTYQYNRGLSITFQSNLFKNETFKGYETQFSTLFYPKAYFSSVTSYAKMYETDPFLILAVMREESHFNPLALSKSNAHGLMQIMLPTGKDIAGRINEKWERSKTLLNPEQNMKFGSFYISYLQNRFNDINHYVIAGYNAGPGRVSGWKKRFGSHNIYRFMEKMPFGETKSYLKRVMNSYMMYLYLYTLNAPPNKTLD